jgi:ribonuclease HI
LEYVAQLTMDEVRLFTDGASRGNPGPAAVCYRVLTADGVVLVEHAECIGRATNNQAEYRALLLGLEACSSFTTGRVRCELDSQLVVNQLSGQFRTYNAELLALRDEVRNAANAFTEVSYDHQPRSLPDIARADVLANQALDACTA